MEISQKRGSRRTRYVFQEDRLEYAWNDSSGSRSFSVPYTGISRDRDTLTERNEWARNAGILWIIIGAGLAAIGLANGTGARGGFWLLLGIGCVAWWWFRVSRYTVLPSEKGNLLVIDGPDGQAVLEQIDARRAAQFRAEYDFFPEGETPEQLRSRFRWLHREGALDDETLQQRLAEVEARTRRAGGDAGAPGAPDTGPDTDPDPDPDPEMPPSGHSLH